MPTMHSRRSRKTREYTAPTHSNTNPIIQELMSPAIDGSVPLINFLENTTTFIENTRDILDETLYLHSRVAYLESELEKTNNYVKKIIFYLTNKSTSETLKQQCEPLNEFQTIFESKSVTIDSQPGCLEPQYVQNDATNNDDIMINN